MGILKKITGEYFGDDIRHEDLINISELNVKMVQFTDKNGTFHKHGYKVEDCYDWNCLKSLIIKIIERRGENCSLNDVDVSNMKFMRTLFSGIKFNGDISGWDVTNVSNMNWMFYGSNFNGNISKWNVQNVVTMESMFYCSDFTGENGIFELKEGNNLVSAKEMFSSSKFNADINDWKIRGDCRYYGIFQNTPLAENGNLPEWYKKPEYK